MFDMRYTIVLALTCCSFAYAGSERATSLDATWTQWADDYAKALKMAQEEGKPLLIAFTGSGWCPWSTRMDEDILSDPNFRASLREEMIFVRIDFPERDVLPLDKKTQYLGLKKRYGIQELPTLVLVDPAGDEIFKIGYVPLEPREVAAHLKTALVDYRQLKDVVGTASLQEMRGAEIQELYKKADSLSMTPMRKQLLEAGLKSDQDAFFMVEQYETMLETHSIQDPEVQLLRKKIAARDPSGNHGIQFKLATVEFNSLSRIMHKKDDPQRIIAPLLAYLQKFGTQDRENCWRVEMMVAQFLFSKNKVAEAITHAKNSYELAPEEYRRDIAQSLDYLSKKASMR